MRTLPACLLALVSSGALAADEFKLHPLAVENPKVPHGTVTKMEPWISKTYEGTVRDWWIYAPAQYSAEKRASLMVFQDGHDYVNLNGHWRAPTVFDNLIARGDMPVTIAVFINPGHDGKSQPRNPWRAGNRSVEYDTLGGKYSRFLLEEIIPEVRKKYRLTDNPAGWAIGGASSGGICSFTVAWERPDRFGKVFSTIGSFTNIRGGNAYPSLIRLTERKPIRIFLADTDNDVDNQFGSWPIANDLMFAALQFMHYEVKFERGEGGHNSNYCGSIFPSAMIWLWRGWRDSSD